MRTVREQEEGFEDKIKKAMLWVSKKLDRLSRSMWFLGATYASFGLGSLMLLILVCYVNLGVPRGEYHAGDSTTTTILYSGLVSMILYGFAISVTGRQSQESLNLPQPVLEKARMVPTGILTMLLAYLCFFSTLNPDTTLRTTKIPHLVVLAAFAGCACLFFVVLKVVSFLQTPTFKQSWANPPKAQ